MQQLDNGTVDCIITSPPYWALRDYGIKEQIGLEKTWQEYLQRLLDIFTEAKRVLKDSGTLWVNMGDTYGGSYCGYGQTEHSKGIQNVVKQPYYPTSKMRPLSAKVFPKSLIGIPQRFSTAMIDNGWLLRNTIIWKKPNAMPESVKDRFTNDFEYLFFFTKTREYFFEQQYEDFLSNNYDMKRMTEGRKTYDGKWSKTENQRKIRGRETAYVGKDAKGRNRRTVWEINTRPFKDAHFAVFPEQLIEVPILAGCPDGGLVLDPFMGSGTTAVVARKFNRDYIGFEINPEFVVIANKRLESSLGCLDNIDFIFKMKLQRKIAKAKLHLFSI